MSAGASQPDLLPAIIQEGSADRGLPAGKDCRLRLYTESDGPLWQALLDAVPEQPVGYHRLHCDYQHAYFASAHPHYRRLDCLILWRGAAVGIWPLAVFGDASGLRLSSHLNGAYGIAPPLLSPTLSDKQRKAVTAAWLEAAAALAAQLDGPTGPLRFVSAQPWLAAPDWYQRLLVQGGRLLGRHRIVADLTLDDAGYHQQLRKSYKALINSAAKTWSVSLDASGDAAAFAEFQALHVAVAGRQTRPDNTWQLQFEAIAAGAAFAVYLRDGDGRLVGASLYNASRDEIYYAVGAYDRRLFDQPVAHLSLYQAIGFARESGRRCFVLGDRPFPGDPAPPSDKEAKIAFFKEGFATALQLLPSLEIETAAFRPKTAPAADAAA